MGLLDKVKNVVRDNLPDAVTNTDISGQSDEMIHKFEKIGLITGSKLIVRETQEAIFMRNGEIAQIFGPGKYDLETDNIPLAKTILTMVYGGTNPNAAEIWFINKSSMMGVGWGTPQPLNIEDSRFGFPITLGVKCNGKITVKVADSRLLFTELAGIGKSFTMEKFHESVRHILTSKLRKIIGSCMDQNKLSFIQLQNNINFLEAPMVEAIVGEIARYGLSVEGCYVDGFKVVEDESWQRYKEYEDKIISYQLDTQLEAGRMNTQTQTEAIRMQTLGYDYATERQFDVMQTAASNEGNPMVNAPIGLGVGFGAAAAIAPAMVGAAGAVMPQAPLAPQAPVQQQAPAAPAAPTAAHKCPKCGAAATENSKFCLECGYVLKSICLSCKAVVENNKFCPECGKKIVICPHCGSDTEVDATHCQKCGGSLASGVVCPQCGKQYEDVRKFCSECGSKIE